MELIFLLGGILIGGFSVSFLKKGREPKPSGVLNLAQDEDGEYLFLELHESVKSVRCRKTATFYVKNVDTQQ